MAGAHHTQARLRRLLGVAGAMLLAAAAGSIATGHLARPAAVAPPAPSSESPVSHAHDTATCPEVTTRVDFAAKAPLDDGCLPATMPSPSASVLLARESVAPNCAAGKAPVHLTVDFTDDQDELCLPLSSDGQVGSRIDPVYTRAANIAVEQSSEATKDADVRPTIAVCWSYADWNRLGELYQERDFSLVGVFGFLSAVFPVINLSPETCRLLDDIAYEETRSNNIGLGKAVGVLAHEAMHVAGIADESAAACYGAQLTAPTALALGTDADYAATLQQRNWKFDQDYWDDTEYFSPECLDGGALDLDPNQHVLAVIETAAEGVGR